MVKVHGQSPKGILNTIGVYINQYMVCLCHLLFTPVVLGPGGFWGLGLGAQVFHLFGASLEFPPEDGPAKRHRVVTFVSQAEILLEILWMENKLQSVVILDGRYL